MNRMLIILIYILFSTSVAVYVCMGYSQYAFANGFTQSKMTCSNDKNYTTSLCIGIFPLLLKNGVVDDFIIRFELYDTENKTVYPNAEYDISVVKNEYATSYKDMTVLGGIFVTKNGFLTLYINTSSNQEQQIPKKEDGIFHKTVFTNRNDSANLTIPFRLISGQYIIYSTISIPDKQPLYFNSVLQIGEIKSQNFYSHKHLHNLTIISYYDRIKDLIFDENTRSVSWQIPFDYNLTRIDEGKVTVHEEIIIPNSMLELMNSKSFNMTMNNRTFDSSLIKADPYTNGNNTIIHYVPDTNTLFDLSNNRSDTENLLMNFDLYLR